MPEARVFVNTVHEVIKTRGFIKNFYGRRRRLTTDECYKAPNSLIQGCAADYIKHKLVDIYKYINHNKLTIRMINIVHDEIIFEIPEHEMQYAETLRYLLSDFSSFRVPITAGLEQGNPSWGEKFEPDGAGFKEVTDKSYLEYNVFNGEVFDINKT
jgi:DNA polymerase-1